MRSLPSNANTQVYRQYEVVKPVEVEKGVIAPAYGQPGGGTQYKLPVKVDVLVKRGVLERVPK